MPELAEQIRSLSPAALNIYKRQLKGLSGEQKRLAFSRISGIPELSDILGESPAITRQATTQPERQPTEEKPPLWQRGLQAFGAPFQFVQEKAINPALSVALSPITPTTPETVNLPWFQREQAEYQAWQAPKVGLGFNLPQFMGGQEATLGVKGALEMLPWMAVPSFAGIAGKIGSLAAKAGRFAPLVKGAAAAVKYSPWGLAEKAVTAPVGAAAKAIRGIGKPFSVTVYRGTSKLPVKEEFESLASKGKIAPYGTTAQEIKAVANGTKPVMLIARNDIETARSVGLIVKRLSAFKGERAGQMADIYGAYKKGNLKAFQQLDEVIGKAQRGELNPIDRHIQLGKVLGYSEADVMKYLSDTYDGYEGVVAKLTPDVEASKITGEQIAKDLGVPPVKPPIKPPPLAQSGGFSEDKQTAIAWLVNLVKRSKPLAKETLELRKPEHAERGAKYGRVLQEEIAGGMPAKEAREAAKKTLYEAGKYSTAPMSPQFLNALQEQGKYEVTLYKMIADANFPPHREFTQENTFAALDKLFTEGRLQMNQIQLLEQVFGEQLAKELLAKHRTFGEKAWFEAVDIANVPRGLLSMADLSGMGRQGWVLTTTRPKIAIKAFRPMIEAMLKDENALFMEQVFTRRPHMNKVLKLRPDFLTKFAGEATDIGAREEGFATRWLNKIPVIGQIYRGSARAYTTVLNDLRSANVSASISGWEKSGFKYLPEDEAGTMFGGNRNEMFKAKFYDDIDIDMVARTVSWASGRGSLPKELARHAGVANAMFFAPKLIMSHVQFPFAASRLVNPSILARKEATRELMSFIGTGAGIIVMAKISGVAEVELDPRSADFGKLKSEDTRLDIWSGYAQYLRFVTQMATAQGKTESGRITTKKRNELIWRFVQSKLSPAAGLINDIAAGETYLGEDLPPKGAKSIAGQAWQRMMPLAIQDIVDGYMEDSWNGGIISTAGIFGVGVVTYTDELKRTRDKVAREKYGVSWEEVGMRFGRAEQLRLEQTSDTVIKAEKEYEQRFGGGTQSTMKRFQTEGESIEQTYREAVSLASKEFHETNDGVRFREKIADAQQYRRTAYGARAKKGDYQDIIAYYNQPLSQDQTAKMNTGDVIRREYYQQLFGLDMYDQYGNYRFDEAELREEAFERKFGQQAIQYIEEYQGATWLDKPAEMRMLEEAKDVLRPYWQIADQIWSLYPPELQELSNQITLLERTEPQTARTLLRRYPAILRARELIATYRKQMKLSNPTIGQYYRMFYG